MNEILNHANELTVLMELLNVVGVVAVAQAVVDH